jgi:hypothetical protein
MKTEAHYAKQLVAVTTVLRVFVTYGSSAIRAFPDHIPTTGINSCILPVRHLDDFTIHFQFTTQSVNRTAISRRQWRCVGNSSEFPSDFSVMTDGLILKRTVHGSSIGR